MHATSPDLRVGSLCSGYGGLDLAVHQVIGGRLAWVADPDPGAARILARHWPDVPNHGDITAVDWTTVEPIDLLTAGFPCQPWSDAGRRHGADDDRHLWPAVATAVRHLGPRLVVLENVSGFAVRGAPAVLGELATLGYDTRWTRLPASDVGAAHQRERWFALAWRGAGADPDRP
ncbi:DNA cytosine methyltransferase [Parafrankia sp. EUN1f]|uniref:DNA cytosine methyltransferase n=1 Tax=Parafrankia sp. EUN1f TaxID=102897 RepID=UPI0001C4690A|nr:DNA cytosine methyltransferase [Parafrankia sp. EUN1f]EFC80267.1 C-5 cytosine-specific DNA methylase [Parafrankia sp. EUN1f]